MKHNKKMLKLEDKTTCWKTKTATTEMKEKKQA